MKDIIRNSYHPYVTENTVSFKAGQEIQVSREQLLSFIEKAVDTINDQQKRTMSIYKCFKICGLNPWDEDLTELKIIWIAWAQTAFIARF